jgi:hypothetical protein
MVEDWIEMVIGALLILAPWVFGFAAVPLAKWTDMLAGAVLVVMNLAAMYGRRSTPQIGIVAEGTATEIVEAVSLAPRGGAGTRLKRTRRSAARTKKAGANGGSTGSTE